MDFGIDYHGSQHQLPKHNLPVASQRKGEYIHPFSVAFSVLFHSVDEPFLIPIWPHS